MGGKSGNTFVRGGKYATIGVGGGAGVGKSGARAAAAAKNTLQVPYKEEGFNMAKKVNRPGPLIHVQSISKIFKGSKLNLNK